MPFLYLTADRIGTPTGGGRVTAEELKALSGLALAGLVARGEEAIGVTCDANLDPFAQDRQILERLKAVCWKEPPILAHCYAGCLTETVAYLRALGCKITYTVAAHNVDVSRRAHAELGLSFPYPHLTDPALWERYTGGYRAADVLVCPSTVALRTLRRQGMMQRVEVIPHGVDLPPDEPAAPPARFTVGYLGAYGCDKGVVTLLRAWAALDDPAALLVLAGRDSTSAWVRDLIVQVGGSGNVHLAGWLDDPGAFYRSLSCYTQPSATEGYGIEVAEALAHGVPVLCSDGAGASDLVDPAAVFKAGDVGALVYLLEAERRWWEGSRHRVNGPEEVLARVARLRASVEGVTWDKVRQRYKNLWTSLLEGR